MRGVEYRAASRAELIATGETLKQPRALILALTLARNLGDTAYFATVDTANFAVRPAYRFDVIKTILVSFESAGNVYELHGFLILFRRYRTTICEITAVRITITSVLAMKEMYQTSVLCQVHNHT